MEKKLFKVSALKLKGFSQRRKYTTRISCIHKITQFFLRTQKNGVTPLNAPTHSLLWIMKDTYSLSPCCTTHISHSSLTLLHSSVLLCCDPCVLIFSLICVSNGFALKVLFVLALLCPVSFHSCTIRACDTWAVSGIRGL